MVLENTLKGPLDGKEIKLVNPKGNQANKGPYSQSYCFSISHVQM